MTNLEAWRRMYRSRRYCRDLTQTELNQRIRDIFLGFLTIEPSGKIGLRKMGPEGVRWMTLWTHVLEEMALRHGPFPKGFTREILHSEPFPDFIGALGRRTASILASRNLQPNTFLIKFGKAKHMRELFEEGKLRVSPATYYAVSTHNGAIRDDELSLPLSISLTREDVMKVVLNPQDVPKDLTSRRLDINYRCGTDYWIYCLTTVVESRLFVDFNADACVVIRNLDDFSRRLHAAGAAAFPSAGFSHGQVKYIDPLLPETATIDVCMSKHFRYEYQGEYRFLWRPMHPQAALPYADLRLGRLSDIAELVVAEGDG